MKNLRKFCELFFFFFRRPTLHGQGQNQHAEAKISTSSANAKGKTCPLLATPRHQRAHAKAPTRWPCPCQGTNACSLPTPRHQRAHAKAKTCPRLATPRHQRVGLAHAKAPTCAACPCQGNPRWWVPPVRGAEVTSPPKEVLKHLQVCQEGTHLVLERSPSRIKTSFVRIFSRSFAEVLRIRL